MGRRDAGIDVHSRLPLVFAHPVSPSSASNSRNANAASTASAKPRPGWGSRSMRNSFGLSLLSARPATDGRSPCSSARHTRPLPTRRRRSGRAAAHSDNGNSPCAPTRASLGRILLVELSPSMPGSGNRCRVTGRSPMARRSGSPPRAIPAARSPLVMPASGHMSRSGCSAAPHGCRGAGNLEHLGDRHGPEPWRRAGSLPTPYLAPGFSIPGLLRFRRVRTGDVLTASTVSPWEEEHPDAAAVRGRAAWP